MDYNFDWFFNIFKKELIDRLLTYGCSIEESGSGKVICHSTKFVKGIATFVMLSMVGDMPKNEFVYTTEKMIHNAFYVMEEQFYIKESRKKRAKCINKLIEKHFSVIFRELSKCFPSNVIFVGTNVGEEDCEIYAKQQFREGRPVDVRRLRKIKAENKLS